MIRIHMKRRIGHGDPTVNAASVGTVGQAFDISVTGAADGSVSLSSSLGSTFSPNPATSSGGSAASTYTPAAAGSDTITATDSSGATGSATVTISAAGGGSTPQAAATNSAVLAAAQAMNQVTDFTSTAACAPVMAFQNAWNAAGGSPTLTVDGGYGAQTAAAAGQVAAANGGGNVAPALTSGFPTCGSSPQPPTPPQPPVNPPATTGGHAWLWWLVGGLAVLGLGGLGLWYYKRHKKGHARERKGRKSKRKG
jgi:LPXTG-motif cell wall-anchored protein